MILLILVGFLVLCITVYWRRTTYWRRRGVPGPPSTVFFGNGLQLGHHFRPDCFQLQAWTQRYGKFYGIQKGWKNVLVVSDADMVAEMLGEKFDRFHGRMTPPIREDVDDLPDVHLFQARGKRWKRLRTLSNAAFSVRSLKNVMPILNDSARQSVQFLEQRAANGDVFNIHPYFHEFTMDTICRIAMGQTESQQFRNEYVHIVLYLLSHITSVFGTLSWIVPATRRTMLMLAMAHGAFQKTSFVGLRRMLQKAVLDRKEQRARGEINTTNVDFIDMFLDAEADTVEVDHTERYDKSAAKVSRKLTTSEVIAQCMLFIIAGFDTTANSLAVTCYYLAVHPQIQEKLRQEIEDNCFSEEPDFDELNKLKYADAVMKEVLRLHPVGTQVFNRSAACDTTLGGIPLEAGTHVQVDTITLHRSKAIYGEDADEFKPERWLAPKPPTTFYGFGGGPRICIGMRLAYLEEKLVLAHILRRFRIVSTDQTKKPDFTGLIVLNPDQVTVKLQEL